MSQRNHVNKEIHWYKASQSGLAGGGFRFLFQQSERASLKLNTHIDQKTSFIQGEMRHSLISVSITTAKVTFHCNESIAEEIIFICISNPNSMI